MATGTIKQTGATAGACTYTTAYFETPVINTVEKYGQVVHIVFCAKIKAAIPNGTFILTDIPKYLYYIQRIPCLYASTLYMSSPTLEVIGSLASSSVQAYAVASTYVGKFIYMDFTYMSED